MPRLSEATDIANGLLFDTIMIPTTNTALSFRFFQQSIASSHPSLTNMDQAGQMPWPEGFIIRSIRLGPGISGSFGGMAGGVFVASAFASPTTLPDALELTHGAVCTLTIGNKPYLKGWPAHIFSAGHSVAATSRADPGVLAAYLGDGRPDTAHVLSHPIELLPNEKFEFKVDYPVAAAPAANVPLMVAFSGTWVRAVQ